MALTVLVAPASNAVDTSLDGYWNGYFSTIFQNVVLHFETGDRGKPTVTMQMSRRPGQRWVADEVSVDGTGLKVTFSTLNSRFEGTLSKTGKMLAGEWRLGDRVISVNLLRAKEPQLQERFDWLTPTKAAPSGIRFEISDINGEIVSSADETLDGKVILIDIWGTWCPPCQKPMASNNGILERRKDWDGKATILAISIDDSLELPRDHMDERGWTHVPGFWAPRDPETHIGTESKAAQAYGVVRIPATILIDQDGIVRARGDSIDPEPLIDNLLGRSNN